MTARKSHPIQGGRLSGAGRVIIEWIGLFGRYPVRGLAHDLDDFNHNIAPVATGDALELPRVSSPLHLRRRQIPVVIV
jgi:hypothetical protein